VAKEAGRFFVNPAEAKEDNTQVLPLPGYVYN